VKIAKTLQRFG